MADEVSPTPDCTHLLFLFYFLQARVTPMTEGAQEEEEKEVKHMARGHRWHRTNGDVSQVALKNRGLVLAVAICGDKLRTVAAKYGQTVAAVDSWSS